MLASEECKLPLANIYSSGRWQLDQFTVVMRDGKWACSAQTSLTTTVLSHSDN